MILPLFGFLTSFAIFTGTGSLILGLIKRPPLTLINLIIFIASAYFGAFLYGTLYRMAFADASGEVRGTWEVVIGLFGLPVTGVGVGWIAAILVDRLRRKLRMTSKSAA